MNFEVVGHADPSSDTPRGGVSVPDAADHAGPKPTAYWESGWLGVGRFSFDGRHSILSAEVAGYDGSICRIVDLDVPYRPEDISHWHVPGQWHEGGEERVWAAGHVRCHHPIQYLCSGPQAGAVSTL